MAALGNLNGQGPEAVAASLASLAHGETVRLTSERKEIKLSPEILKQYAGTYQVAPDVNLTITVEGDQLMGQLSGQARLPHFAESETRFFLKAVDAQLEFLKDSSGKVTHAVIHQNGRETRFDRKSDTVLQRKEVKVSPEILSRYAGTYEMRPGFDLVIALEGDQLMAQPSGQTKNP